jgi:glycosyltransferase involved in cell wall biosynthesis
MKSNNYSYEVIFIDDGSTDKSWSIIEQLSSENPNSKGIRFLRNYGKSQALHAGFAKVQYFYSSDSSETLVVPYESIENLPNQLSSPENEIELREVESKLPKPSNNQGEFKYYNPLRCPFCQHPYIDFEKHKEIRPNEYYGNTYINQEVIAWDT